MTNKLSLGACLNELLPCTLSHCCSMWMSLSSAVEKKNCYLKKKRKRNRKKDLVTSQIHCLVMFAQVTNLKVQILLSMLKSS